MAASTDGIWTGHDWQNTVAGLEDVNGELKGLTDAM